MAFGKDVGFYILFEDTMYQLPINPAEVNIVSTSNNKTVESVWLGEITIPRRRKLKELSFESFFPGSADSFPGIRTLGKFVSPTRYVHLFDKMMKYGKVAKLSISGLGFAINMDVTVEKFETTIKAGEHEDVYYSIQFKEYVNYSAKELVVKDSQKTSTTSTSSTTKKTTRPASNITLKPKSVTRGCTVILNGTVCYDSYGAKPGKTFKNYKGKINYINLKGTHPYHVTTMNGGWLGWVRKSEVQVV